VELRFARTPSPKSLACVSGKSAGGRYTTVRRTPSKRPGCGSSQKSALDEKAALCIDKGTRIGASLQLRLITRRSFERPTPIHRAPRFRHRRHPDPRPSRVDRPEPPALHRGTRGMADVVSAPPRLGRRHRPRFYSASSCAGTRRGHLSVCRRYGALAETPPSVAPLTAGVCSRSRLGPTARIPLCMETATRRTLRHEALSQLLRDQPLRRPVTATWIAPSERGTTSAAAKTGLPPNRVFPSLRSSLSAFLTSAVPPRFAP
jgi:hypothetical protein